MEYMITYEIEVERLIGRSIVAKEITKHSDRISANNYCGALKSAEDRKWEIANQYIGMTNCKVGDISEVVAA